MLGASDVDGGGMGVLDLQSLCGVFLLFHGAMVAPRINGAFPVVFLLWSWHSSLLVLKVWLVPDGGVTTDSPTGSSRTLFIGSVAASKQATATASEPCYQTGIRTIGEAILAARAKPALLCPSALESQKFLVQAISASRGWPLSTTLALLAPPKSGCQKVPKGAKKGQKGPCIG